MSRILITSILLLAALSTSAFAQTNGAVNVIIGDDPLQCLSLESVFINDSGYTFIDGRNNQGRVKYVDQQGTVTGAIVSTIPLPDAASLPPDILPAPWGMDRVVIARNAVWAVAAGWSGSIAEKFDPVTGKLIERVPDPGLRVSGVTTGPDGMPWAIGRRILLNLSNDTGQSLNLSGNVQHIDCATGHPLGFVILQQPYLLLVETSGIVRWRISMDNVVDGFLSPLDISCGPDGTIAVCAVISDLSNETNRNDYFNLRSEAISRDDEQVLYSVEDALRSNLGMGFAVILISQNGVVSDAIELANMPTACAVDSIGRAHILTQESGRWAMTILDPRLNEGLPQFGIPFGTPGMITPHRIISGPDGGLYWDDVIPGEGDQWWGIAKYLPSTGSSMFSLGAEAGADVRWIYREPMTDFVRLTNAISIAGSGDIRVGCRDFPFSILDNPMPMEQAEEAIENDESYGDIAPLNYLLTIDRSGTLLRRDDPSIPTGSGNFPCEFLALENSLLAVMAGQSETSLIGVFGQGEAWTPLAGLNAPLIIAKSRLGMLDGKIASWFISPEEDMSITTRWQMISSDLSSATEINKLARLGCRLLTTDPATNSIYATIDDGEIFRIDASRMQVTGVYKNRLSSGAVSHPIVDAAMFQGQIAILDTEHRAILGIAPDGFAAPPIATPTDLNNAITSIQSAFSNYKYNNGFYPTPSPGLLDTILTMTELELVKKSFLGGRIYQYRPTDTGFTFTAWSAAFDQPALLCDLYNIEIIF